MARRHVQWQRSSESRPEAAWISTSEQSTGSKDSKKSLLRARTHLPQPNPAGKLSDQSKPGAEGSRQMIAYRAVAPMSAVRRLSPMTFPSVTPVPGGKSVTMPTPTTRPARSVSRSAAAPWIEAASGLHVHRAAAVQLAVSDLAGGAAAPGGRVGDADRVHVRVEQDAGPGAGVERAGDVAGAVDLDLEAELLQRRAHELRDGALLRRERGVATSCRARSVRASASIAVGDDAERISMT